MSYAPRSLIDVLRKHARDDPGAAAFVFLSDGERESVSLTFGELDRRSRSVAAHLQQRGLTGERVLLLLPAGLDFVVGLLGCFYSKAVAVPAYPPVRRRKDVRIEQMVADADAEAALTVNGTLPAFGEEAVSPALRELDLLAIDTLYDREHEYREDGLEPDDLAYLQYTSGSTSQPKGVMITHGNLLHNCSGIQQICRLGPDSVSVSWLPPYHDMGLVTGIAQPIYGGFRGILLPAPAFLRRPIRWLRAISRYRGTLTGGPNAAFDLCIERTTADERHGLDLRSWSIAFNGAEPIRQRTLSHFRHTFAPYGFQAEAMAPAYGMAESTLVISASTEPKEPSVVFVSALDLEQGVVAEVPPGQADCRAIVGCGEPVPGTEVAIVDPASRARCPADHVGEIWVSGPSVGGGYWRNPEESARTFRARLADTAEVSFLRTGDLGFMRNGEVFVTGRIKDLIIVRGRNLYPQDIEATAASSHPALQPDYGAAFAIEDDGRERIVVVQAVARKHLADLDTDEVLQSIRTAITGEYEVELKAVVLTLPGCIPRTTSGKIARRLCRREYLGERLEVVAAWRAPSEDRRNVQEIHNWLAIELARKFSLDVTAIDPNQRFTEHGIDSLSALELTARLEEWLGRHLPDTTFWDYPTIELLARYLSGDVPSAPPALRER